MALLPPDYARLKSPFDSDEAVHRERLRCVRTVRDVAKEYPDDQQKAFEEIAYRIATGTEPKTTKIRIHDE